MHYLTLGVHSTYLILIDAVYLDGRDHGFNDGHHALAYVAVECKITAERLDSVSTQIWK